MHRRPGMNRKKALLALATWIAAAGGSPCKAPSPNPSVSDVEEFVKIRFDYLVIGGGTAGLAVSARLAQNPKITVGVIEAGVAHFDDPIIDAPALSGVGNATYDWLFNSVPQINSGGRVATVPRGKLLGGSSGINGLAWGRASSPEYDSLNTFAPGNGWSWAGLLPFMQKSESFSLKPENPYPGITKTDAAAAALNLPRVDGFTGPIIPSYNSFYFDISETMVQTMNGLGFKTNPQPQGGNATSVFNTLASVDRAGGKGVRSYSATTYFCSQASNKNFHVLTNAQATQIILSRESGGLKATGVKFISNGKTFTAQASKEIILSAGTVQTPQLLELSGIGNSTILGQHGIQVLEDLPGVGENFQEHVFTIVQWQLKQGVDTFDILHNNPTFAAEQLALFDKNQTGLLTATDSTVAFLPLAKIVDGPRLETLLAQFDQETRQAGQIPIQKVQEPFMREWFAEDRVASLEFIQWSKGLINPAPGVNYTLMLGGLLHPMSRGTVHISSNNPLTPPTIDLNFLSSEFDTQVVLDALKFMKKLGTTKPFSDFVEAVSEPDPSLQTDDELLAYVRATAVGGDHLVGTAALAPRSSGGVVDSSLKVYGTTNLRVVDASVIPLQIAAHTQATVYAIAEKAADMILRQNA